MSEITGYINDGYTLKGYIAPKKGIHGALRFEYRPLTFEERVKLFENWSTLSGEAQIGRACSALSKRIVSWDLRSPAGQPVPARDPNSFRRLTHTLNDRLLDIIAGASAPDDDPADQKTDDSGDGLGFLDETPEGNLPAVSLS